MVHTRHLFLGVFMAVACIYSVAQGGTAGSYQLLQQATSAASSNAVPLKALTADVAATSTDTFQEFVRSPAENATSNSFKWQAMSNNTAYYRDFFAGGQTYNTNPSDGDVYGATMVDPNGLTAIFYGFAFHSSWSLNGTTQNNCWVNLQPGADTICGSTSLTITWFFQSQCSTKGTYTMTFTHNNATYYTGTFQLLPQIPPGTIPIYNQADSSRWGNLQYGNVCNSLDSNGNRIRHSAHTCHTPRLPTEQVATIRQLGCALTDAAMILSYFGVSTTPDVLNTWLTSNNGYDISGNILFPRVAAYAQQNNVQVSYIPTWGSPGTAYTDICTNGPLMMHVHNNSHFVTGTGRDFNLTTWLINDPDGGKSTTLNDPSKPYANTFTNTRRFTGPSYTYTMPNHTVVHLHSPAELLLTDPNGMRTGVDPISGTTYDENPNNSYGDGSISDPEDSDTGFEEKELVIGQYTVGTYNLRVTGTGDGTYSLEIFNFDGEGNIAGNSTLLDFPVTAGSVQNYSFVISNNSTATPQFTGSFNGGGQTSETNTFLTYANPTSISTTLPAGTSNFPLLIFYGSTVNASAFQASLNGQDVSSLFHPAPGTFESVNLALSTGSNSLNLQISGTLLSGSSAIDTDSLTFLVGSIPPSAPTNLTATATSTNEIDLTWIASTTSGVTYSVFRSLTSGFTPSSANQIASGLSGTAYSDTGLSPSTTYYYVVESTNAAGSSPASNQVSASTQPSTSGTVPASPTGLSANALSSSEISLYWTASSTSGVTYSVFRSTTASFAPSGDNQIASAIVTTSYQDMNLTPSTIYYYVVEAVNAAGSSPASNQASATTQSSTSGGSAPNAPSGLTATAASSSQINLSWNFSSGSGVSYNVFRSTTSGFTASSANQIASGIGSTNYSDSGLAASTTYHYVVEALNSNGSSPASNQASATTFSSSGNSNLVISGISPQSASIGSPVTVTGQFPSAQGNGVVMINGARADTISWSSSQITVSVPASAASGPLSVVVSGSSSNSVPFTLLTPTVTAISPSTGPAGIQVQISGYGFSPTQGSGSVTINSLRANVQQWGDTQIIATVPQGAISGPVVVTNYNISSSGSVIFSVPTPQIVSISPASGGDRVQVSITGSGFGQYQGSSTVTFNGSRADTISWSDQNVVVLAPNSVTTGPVVVTVNGVNSNGALFTAN